VDRKIQFDNYDGENIMNQNTTPSILIADDQVLFRRILEMILNKEGWRDITSVSTGQQAIEKIIEHKPDVLLLDIHMPDMDGIAALSIIKQLAPDLPTIMLTSYPDQAFKDQAFELGAEAFFSKRVSSHELVETVRILVSGERSEISISLRSDPASYTVPTPTLPLSYFPKEKAKEPIKPPKQELTHKETIILTLLAAGYDNQSIVEKLEISRNTVKTHMRNIFAKLDVTDRTQAAIWAVQNGLGSNLLSSYQT
jgi:DNA-binding NarL/FixJ family response regulator